MITGRTVAIAAAVLLFSAPFAASRLFGVTLPSGYLSLGFVALLAAIVALWPNDAATATTAAGAQPSLAAALLAALVGAIVVAYGLQRWVHLATTQPFSADMLIVIREAAGRFLQGLNPYITYRTYDAPWGVVLPYGPLLWGPYVIPWVWHVDLRVITVIGELFVPIAAVVAAAVEAARGRLGSALSWLLLVGALVGAVEVSGFTQIGHTPVYWPLLPLFAWLVAVQRWPAAALTLGLLLVARSTMVAIVPVFLITIWLRARADVWRLTMLLALPVVLLYGPFLIWDPVALWENVVASYPRIVKSVVWASPDYGLANTLGATGWLVGHGLERWVVPSELAALAVVVAAAWRAGRRGAAPLPWMAAALAAFSLTALWPVYYLYFDVLLLFTSAALADTLAEHLSVRRWAIGVAVVALAVTATLFAATDPAPIFDFVPASAQRVVALPRRATGAAFIEIEITGGVAGAPPVAVRATLNGQDLGTVFVVPGGGPVRFPAPAAAWWTGFNQLELSAGPDATGLAVRRIAVVPSRR